MKTLDQVLTKLEAELLRIGYKESTLNYYRSQWRQIKKFFEEKGETNFSEKMGMAFLEEKHHYSKKIEEGSLTQSNIYALRVIRMIGDFQMHKCILRRYTETLSLIQSSEFEAISEQFATFCDFKEYSKATKQHYTKQAERLLAYFESQKCMSISKIKSELILSYIDTLKGYSYKTIELALCGMRRFLSFIYLEEMTSDDLSKVVPPLQTRKQSRIPSVWNKDDLIKLLEAIDKGNPAGKRDYALILMVTRLGIRTGDIKRLKLESLNWNSNTIEFVQSKTRKIVKLPLLRDVGWALIDYLENGRPKVDSPYIFLRHLAPIEPFSDEDRLHQIITKYMKLAKIPISPKKRVGMHSLRHTLATLMLETGSPLEIISSTLGHSELDSTSTYIRSSVEMLRECVLDFEEDLR